MRAAAHLFALVLTLPQLLLAAVLLAFGHVTGGTTFWSFVDRSLDLFLALFGWIGLLVLVTLVLLIVAAFIASWRPFAAAFVGLAALASGAVIVWKMAAAVSHVSDFWILVPGIVALALSAWNARGVIPGRADGSESPADGEGVARSEGIPRLRSG